MALSKTSPITKVEIKALEAELEECSDIISKQHHTIESLQKVCKSLSDALNDVMKTDMSVVSYSDMRKKRKVHRTIISSLESEHLTDLAR